MPSQTQCDATRDSSHISTRIACARGGIASVMPSSRFDGKRVAERVAGRIEVIHALDHGRRLRPKQVFGALLDAGVQVADLHLGALDRLAGDFDDHLQHAVRRGMLRPHRKRHRVAAPFDDVHRRQRRTEIRSRGRCGRRAHCDVPLRRALAVGACARDLTLQCRGNFARRRRAGRHVALQRERRPRRRFARRVRATDNLCAADALPSPRASECGADPDGRRSGFRRGRRLRARPNLRTATGRRPTASSGAAPATPTSSARAAGVRPVRPSPPRAATRADGRRRRSAARARDNRRHRCRAATNSRRLLRRVNSACSSAGATRTISASSMGGRTAGGSSAKPAIDGACELGTVTLARGFRRVRPGESAAGSG